MQCKSLIDIFKVLVLLASLGCDCECINELRLYEVSSMSNNISSDTVKNTPSNEIHVGPEINCDSVDIVQNNILYACCSCKCNKKVSLSSSLDPFISLILI